MARIFVSYRREDAETEAHRIADWLDRHFGEAEVFVDIRTLKPGEPYAQVIEETLGSADAVIVVIGRTWLEVKDDAGGRRLDDPTDLLRLEVATALNRGIRVIPVLVEGARMPAAAELPLDLRPLRQRHAHQLTNTQWRAGIEQLIETLDGILRPGTPTTPLVTPLGPLAVLVGLAGLLALLYGIQVKTSLGQSLLEPGFGGPSNFHDSRALWRLASVATTLPTVGLVAGGLVGLMLARDRDRPIARWLGAGLLLGFGVQGAALYAGMLASDDGRKAGFAIAMAGGLAVVGVGGWAYRQFATANPSALPDSGLELSVRTGAAVGAALTLVGMFVDFNGGGSAPGHPYSGSIVGKSSFERWDLFVVVLLVLAIALLPKFVGPRPLAAGLLIAFGIGTTFLWPRFIAIPALENREIASIAPGGFIGLAGAILIVVSGFAARSMAERREPITSLTTTRA